MSEFGASQEYQHCQEVIRMTVELHRAGILDAEHAARLVEEKMEKMNLLENKIIYERLHLDPENSPSATVGSEAESAQTEESSSSRPSLSDIIKQKSAKFR